MRRPTCLAVVLLSAGAVLAAPAIAGAATPPPKSRAAMVTPPDQRPGPDWAALSHQFDYLRTPIRITENGVERRGSVLVRDISYRAPGQDPVSAYLVEPTEKGRH